MAKPYNITITDGTGSSNVLNGSYSVTSNTAGYLNSSIDPSTLDVTSGTDTYELKISADGVLTLHVSETGESSGKAVVGASFVRCDESGNTYGSAVVSDSTGNAVFSNVPYDENSEILIYYKQVSSDGEHEFDSSLKSISLDASTKTFEIVNSLAALRTFKLTDANYAGLPIKSGSITLS